jgi:hypothetical protein
MRLTEVINWIESLLVWKQHGIGGFRIESRLKTWVDGCMSIFDKRVRVANIGWWSSQGLAVDNRTVFGNFGTNRSVWTLWLAQSTRWLQ